MGWKSIVWLTVLGSAIEAQRPNPPVRLALILGNASVNVGDQVSVSVELRDAYNQAARAPKSYKINLELWVQNRVTNRQLIEIMPGSTGFHATVPIREPGVALIKVTHPELREDAAYVRAKLRRATPGRGRLLPPWVAGENSPISVAFRRPFGAEHETNSPTLIPVKDTGHSSGLSVDILYSDMGAKLTSNGSDRAKITAFLSAEAPKELRLFFFNDGGVLGPNPIVIPSRADFGEAYLTSERPGNVNVKYLRSNDDSLVQLHSGNQKDIQFEVAIKEISLKASPPQVLLGDWSEIQLEFVGLHGEAIKLPVSATIYFSLDSGLGDFDPEPLRVPENGIPGTTRFTPRKIGKVAISASSYGARTPEPRPVDVYFPGMTAILIFVFAAVPSLLKNKRAATGWGVAILKKAGS